MEEETQGIEVPKIESSPTQGEKPASFIDTSSGVDPAPQELPIDRLISGIRRDTPSITSTGTIELDNRISNRVDPSEYGLVDEGKINLRVQDVDPNDYYATLSTGKQISRYQEYIPGIDNTERLAQMQTRSEKWGNSIKKFGQGVGAAIVGGTAGLVTGAMEAITEGNASAIHSNYFTDWAYELNEKNDYKLPVYTTEEYDRKSLLKQMGYANFWAEDVLGGSTFTVGMLATEAIWAGVSGGTSLISAAPRIAARTAARIGAKGAAKRLGAEAVKKSTKKLINNATVKQAQKGAMESTVGAGKLKGLMNTGRQIYTSAFYEAATEAKFFVEETREDYISEFEMRNGRGPTMSEMSDFESDLMHSANWVTAANVALVGGTNIWTFGKFLTGTKATGQFKNNVLRRTLFGQGLNKNAKGLVTALKPTKMQKVAGRVYGISQPVISEGLVEEGGQNVIETSASEYIMSAYDPGLTRDSMDMTDALYAGMAEAYGTKEGAREILVGGIVGLLFGGAQSKFKFDGVSKGVKAMELEARKTVNSTYDHVIHGTIFSNKSRQSATMANEAAKNGDKVGVEVASDLSMVTKMERDHMFGGVEQGAADYRAYLHSKEVLSEIQEELGVDKSTALEIAETAASEYLGMAEEYSLRRDFAEATFGQRDFVEFDNAKIQRETIVAATAAFLTIGENADVRASNTIEQIKEKIVSSMGTTEAIRSMDTMDALRKVDRNAYQRYRRASKNLETVAKKHAELENRITELNSTRELNETEAREREKVLKDYNRLTEKMNAEQSEKDTAFNAMKLQGISERGVTQEDLDSQTERLDTLEEAISRLEGRNPTMALEVRELIKEYEKSVEYATTYTALAERLINPDFRLTEINNWATKLFKGKRTLEEGQSEYFQELQQQYYDSGIASVAEADAKADAATQTPETEESEPEKMVVPTKEEVRKKIDKFAKKLQDGGKAETAEEEALQSRYPREVDLALQALNVSERSVETIRGEITENQEKLAKLQTEESQSEMQTETRKTEIQKEIDDIQTQIEDLQAEEISPVEGQVTEIREDIKTLEEGKDLLNTNEVEEAVTELEEVIAELQETDKQIKEEKKAEIKNLQEQKEAKAEELEREGDQIVETQEVEESPEIAETQQEIEALEEELRNRRPSEKFVTAQIQALRNKIKELINSNQYTKQYVGEDVEEMLKNKPTKEDVDKFTEYLDRMSNEAIEEMVKSRDSKEVTKLAEILDSEGFTAEEIEGFMALNKNLGNWNVLDGVSENGTSIAELLSILEQYEGMVTPKEFKKALAQKDYNDIKTAEKTEMKGYDSASGLQSPDTVKSRVRGENLEISHMEIGSLAETLEADSVVEVKKDGEEGPINENTFKDEGTTFKITKGDTELTVTVGEHARLIANFNELKAMSEGSRFMVVDYGSTSNFDIYERIGETEEFKPMEGDFTYGTRKINYNLLGELKPGERTFLAIDSNDPYNKKKIAEYKRKAKKADSAQEGDLRRDLMNNLHIYVTTENGEILGSLRAFISKFNAKSEEVASLLRARENAVSYVIEGELDGNIDLEMSVPVNIILEGSPNYVVQEGEGGELVPTTMEFTDESLKKVKATGVWEDGELVINREGMKVVDTFVKHLEGSVPIIVFEHNGKNIAFPVSLLGTVENQTNLIEGILELDQKESDKIRLINNLLIEKGINPAENALDPTATLDAANNQAMLARIMEQFEAIEDFPNVEVWKDQNFSLSLLKSQATISIDLTNRPLGTSKVILKLQELEITNRDKLRETIFKGKTEVEIVNDILKSFQELGDVAETEGMLEGTGAMVTGLVEQTEANDRTGTLEWTKGLGRYNLIKPVVMNTTIPRNASSTFKTAIETLRTDIEAYERDKSQYKKVNTVHNNSLKKQIEDTKLNDCK